MSLKVLSPLAVILFATAYCLEAESSPGPDALNREIANTPKDISVLIEATDFAMDGGAVLNDLRFSNGRKYVLKLDFPLDLASDKVLYPNIHFTISIRGDWVNREVLEHGSAAERRLIELLKRLMESTEDSHQKKNAASLVLFLRDRKQPFPSFRSKYWDRIR